MMSSRFTCLCLASIFLATAAAQQPWQQSRFMIGSYYDAPYVGVESAEERAAQLRTAHEAGFNFVLDTRIEHGYTPADNKAAARRTFREAGFALFLSEASLRGNLSANLLRKRLQELPEGEGIYYADEPREGDLQRVATAAKAAREVCPQRAFFVNLLPSGGFKTWADFERYARSYADPATGLPLLCFDNYHPATHFTRKADKPGYFSNLALMRTLAGDRPLWSYIKTRSDVARRDTASQRAFLWLSAFAPLAYGAKGLLYFTYDRYETGDIRRDFDYHARPGWNQRLYAELPGEPAQKFLCRLRDNAEGIADLAMFTPEGGGTWSVKYAKADGQETTKRTDWEQSGAGEGIPFTGDLDGDGRDELLLLKPDGTLTITQPQNDNRQPLSLTALPYPNKPDLTRQQPAVGNGPGSLPVVADFDGNGKADLAVQSGTTTYLFWDYDARRAAFKRHTEATGRYIVQLIFHEGQLYGLEETYLYALDRTTGWKRLRELKMNAQAGRTDHFWMEDGRLYAQDSKARVWYERQADGDLNAEMTDHKENFLYKFSLKNYRTSRYDFYGILLPRYDYDALLDTRRRPTTQYAAAKAANNYILRTLAPIVMQEEWLGAYFASIPTGEQPSAVAAIDAKTPVLRSATDGTLVGLFRKDARTLHLLCVNLTDRPLRPALTLEAKSAALLPMLPAEAGIPREALRTDPRGKRIGLTLPTLRGGECAALEVSL